MEDAGPMEHAADNDPPVVNEDAPVVNEDAIEDMVRSMVDSPKRAARLVCQ